MTTGFEPFFGLVALILLILGAWKALEIAPKLFDKVFNKIRSMLDKNAEPISIREALARKFKRNGAKKKKWKKTEKP